ncbi:MAG TPA: ester cyclase [Bacteroidota bacterium]|nr:ester cyclase [Bacteroidota bacterium]
MTISRLPASIAVSGLVLSASLLFASCGQPGPSERLKPLVDTYVRAWNTGDFNGLEEAVSSQFELRMTPRFDAVHSLDSLKNSITYWRTAYPDFHITLDEVIYAPNAVTVRWTIRATNTGSGSHPPTGKAVVVPGMSIIHVSAGKIVDEWIASNDLYWAEQLGFNLVPTSPSK